ncbi:hypothetical protein BDV41DRAFT_577061 [Aspergillus transmontanensis]|uniref:Uncharacterized protein n=1 Tax=Aspergillus transmontanensis TaxID=1034304 RepID=A0A5N6VXZ3_9EURO|nr:hypothetical protein BDV41DRAFT_577061 [Aspergillus transmontanensis]
MSDRKEARIRFIDPESFEEHQKEVFSIINDDTETDEFIMQPSFPPIICPPPLTKQAVNKLKALSGVQVILPEDEE